MEVDVGFKCLAVEPVHAIVGVVGEHAEVGLEQLTYHELEELFLDTSLVDCGLVLEYHSERPVQVVDDLFADQSVQRVFKEILSLDDEGEVGLANRTVDVPVAGASHK